MEAGSLLHGLSVDQLGDAPGPDGRSTDAFWDDELHNLPSAIKPMQELTNRTAGDEKNKTY